VSPAPQSQAPDSHPPEGARNYVRTPRGAVHFHATGSGPLMIFLHDIGSSHHSFDAIMPRFAQKHRTFAVDLLGHGNSDLQAEDLSAATQAEALLEVIADLHLEDFVLVGHSLGGSVALQVAAQVPRKVHKLVLLAAGCYEYRFPLTWNFFRIAALWAVLGRLGKSRVLERVKRRLYRDPQAAARSPAFAGARSPAGWAALGRAFRQNTSHDTLSELEEIVDAYLEHPSLIIWGSEDPVSPVASARFLFRDKPNVRFIEISGASHFPHEDHPDAVADMILEFLK
jgi:pimeloyl-ACP methyl ester carboxylesterase